MCFALIDHVIVRPVSLYFSCFLVPCPICCLLIPSVIVPLEISSVRILCLHVLIVVVASLVKLGLLVLSRVIFVAVGVRHRLLHFQFAFRLAEEVNGAGILYRLRSFDVQVIVLFDVQPAYFSLLLFVVEIVRFDPGVLCPKIPQ